jgi:hypothetical protein
MRKTSSTAQPRHGHGLTATAVRIATLAPPTCLCPAEWGAAWLIRASCVGPPRAWERRLRARPLLCTTMRGIRDGKGHRTQRIAGRNDEDKTGGSDQAGSCGWANSSNQ